MQQKNENVTSEHWQKIIESETVYITEGEEAADAICSFGLAAMTSSGRSSEDWSPMDGKRAVIVPNNDKPGRLFATRVANLIQQQAPTAEILVADLSDTWPEIPEKGDAADWSENFDSQPAEYFRAELERIATPGKAASFGLKILKASEVTEKPLKWLWQDRFLIGHVNIIAGDPGLGKSLIAVDAAARVSTGADWPDGSPCIRGKVLYCTTEDGYADTVKPRLNAASANMDHVLFLDCYIASDESEISICLDEHCHHIDRYLDQNPDIRLIVFDTLQSYIGIRTNTYNNSQSRNRVMTPLKRLAENHQVAILCIEHLTKATTTSRDNATYRVQGSIAFTGAARSVWLVCKDKNDPERRYLQASKTNLSPDAQGLGLSFTITGPTGRPRIEWHETNVSTPIAELMEVYVTTGKADPETELVRAERFLQEQLVEPIPHKEISAGAESEGISKATLKRAKESLGVTSKKDGKRWLWVPTEAMKKTRNDEVMDLFPDETDPQNEDAQDI